MDIVKEVAIPYYRSVDPVRYSVYASDLDMLLLNNHFHIGILPYEHLRQLVIDVGMCIKRQPRGQLIAYGHQRVLPELKLKIQTLLRIRIKSKFHLTIKTTWIRELPDGIEQLTVMRPVLLELKAAGTTITITVYHWYAKKPYDISDILTIAHELPSRGWQK
jgi:hypothetical protein